MDLSKTISRALPWLALGAVCALPSLAAAQGSSQTQILSRSCGYLGQIRGWLFGTAYVIGAMGLVLIAISAFMGRFKWSHLIALGGGLFIVAMANLLIRFITNSSNTGMTCTANGVTANGAGAGT